MMQHPLMTTIAELGAFRRETEAAAAQRLLRRKLPRWAAPAQLPVSGPKM